MASKNYFQRRRKEKLYRQWIEKAELPAEAIPQEEAAEEIRPKKVDKGKSRLHILYILLGVAIVLLCVGLILLVTQSC